MLMHDLGLLKEMAVNFPKTAADWGLIAANISMDAFVVSARGAKERWLKTIYVKYKLNSVGSLRRSGKCSFILDEF